MWDLLVYLNPNKAIRQGGTEDDRRNETLLSHFKWLEGKGGRLISTIN